MFQVLLDHHEAPAYTTIGKYTQNTPILVYALPPDDEQIVLETCRIC
jgi:hypothetical protein